MACLVGVLLAGSAGQALACTVCIPVPEETDADRVLSAEAVVLARENPDKPFSYHVTEVLAGEIAGPEIDLFVDSQTRRRLALAPDRAVLLVRDPPEPAPRSPLARRFADDATSSSGWRSLGLASARREAMIRAVLAAAPGWQQGPRGRAARAQFFMPYLADADRANRRLAYLEVGRAEYGLIRRADDIVPPDQVRAFLDDLAFVEWHPLYILLLGMNATAAEQDMIRARMASRARAGATLNLAAWTAAFIEIDGVAAIDWLDQTYLGRPGHGSQAIADVLNALSVHGRDGGRDLRARIAESHALALRTHPNASGQAAVDLRDWRDHRFTGLVRDILRSAPGLDPAVAFALTTYAALDPE